MNAEIFAALRQLEKERGIPVDYMVEKSRRRLSPLIKRTATATPTTSTSS